MQVDGVTPQLGRMHDVFHVSLLRKYHPDPSHVIQLDELELNDKLLYEEKPIRVLDRRTKILRNKEIPLVLILWNHHGVEEATWETEEEMKVKYPTLFSG